MRKPSKEFWIALGVSAMIFIMAVQETSPHARRPEMLAGAHEVVRALEESNQRLTSESYHLQALEYDRHLVVLHRLHPDRARAGAYARALMSEFYLTRLQEFDRTRGAIDEELGKLAQSGASEDVVMARFELLARPWHEAEDALNTVRALPDDQAVITATTWLTQNYEQFMKLSKR